MTANQKTKIVVVVGPTASGKSDLAVEIALRHNGEVISADSRQVYKGLDIGTGKITIPEMKGVRHHGLDIAEPMTRFTAMDWKKKAEEAIFDITNRGKLPVICGGTGFYISSLVNDLGFPEVEADTDEQKKLEEKSCEELFTELKKLDPVRASTIDLKNKRRLSRAILIARKLGTVPVITQPAESKYNAIFIGILPTDQLLRDRINKRLAMRLEAGMIDEVERLNKNGLTFERMDELGLEYRYISQFLQGMLTSDRMIELLQTRIWQYAKRQKTWFRRDTRINWTGLPVDFIAIDKLLE